MEEAHEQRKRRNAGCRSTLKFQRPLLQQRCSLRAGGVRAREWEERAPSKPIGTLGRSLLKFSPSIVWALVARGFRKFKAKPKAT